MLSKSIWILIALISLIGCKHTHKAKANSLHKELVGTYRLVTYNNRPAPTLGYNEKVATTALTIGADYTFEMEIDGYYNDAEFLTQAFLIYSSIKYYRIQTDIPVLALYSSRRNWLRYHNTWDNLDWVEYKWDDPTLTLIWHAAGLNGDYSVTIKWQKL